MRKAFEEKLIWTLFYQARVADCKRDVFEVHVQERYQPACRNIQYLSQISSVYFNLFDYGSIQMATYPQPLNELTHYQHRMFDVGMLGGANNDYGIRNLPMYWYPVTLFTQRRQ
jgi:hypothetical protein